VGLGDGNGDGNGKGYVGTGNGPRNKQATMQFPGRQVGGLSIGRSWKQEVVLGIQRL